MKLRDRSLKSKEKFADSLFAVANSIHSAVFISVFVVPLTAFLGIFFEDQEAFSLLTIVNKMTWGDVGIFAGAYLIPILVGVKAKETAMDLLDEISKSSPQKASSRLLLSRRFTAPNRRMCRALDDF